jgi:hypothetical protein
MLERIVHCGGVIFIECDKWCFQLKREKRDAEKDL